MAEQQRAPLRERTRRAVRAEIAQIALPLFEQTGFDGVSVDEIAQAAGLSTRSVFRYFDTKEDIVVGDSTDHAGVLIEAFQRQPTTIEVWTALNRAFSSFATQGQTPTARRTSALIRAHPALRARHLAKSDLWARLLAPLVQERLDGADPHAGMLANAIVGAALGCLDAAVEEWNVVSTDETEPLTHLVDLAFARLAAQTALAHRPSIAASG